MPDDPPFAFGLRGIGQMRGTIVSAAASGMSFGTLISKLQESVAAGGGRWTTATQRAVSRLYSATIESQRKGANLYRVRGDARLGPNWIGFGFLNRSAVEFRNNPRYRVQYRVTGTRDGVPIDKWITSHYITEGPLPGTVGGLREDLINTALEGETEDLHGSELSVNDITINAI